MLNEIHAARQRRDVQYWRTKSGHEIDFVIPTRRAEPIALECKCSQDAFGPDAIRAFRQRYPRGRNVLVAADVWRSTVRRFRGLDVEVIGLADVAARVT